MLVGSEFVRHEPDQEDSYNHDLPHWAQWAPSKLKLWAALGPIIVIPFIINPALWFGRVWMTVHAPWLLIICSNKVVYLALAVTQISAVVYYLIAVTRRIIFAPCYFYLGRWGGDAALDYLADSSPGTAKTLDRLRRWFPKAAPLLVMFYPSIIVRVLAGASGMRFKTFFIYECIGAVTVAIAVRTLALQFPAQMEQILDAFKKYTWQLTIGSLVLVLIITMIKEAMNPNKNRQGSFHDLEDAVEEGIEREEHRHHRDDRRR